MRSLIGALAAALMLSTIVSTGALAAEAEGKLQLMPPTYFLLKEISEFHSVEAVWQAEHQVRPVLSPPGSMAAFLKERGNKQ